MLKYFITSKTKRSLLKLFLTNPDKSFYTRQIARLTGEPATAVRRELGYLEQAGLLKYREEGNLKLFEVIKEFPFYAELKKMIYATIGLGDYLKNKLNDPSLIEIAFIYGSVAKDEETAKSDIDLFVVGSIGDEELHKLSTEIETEIGREVNYTLMTKFELAKRRESGDPFLKRVVKEKKLILKGNTDVFR
jgi:predicted nucleotidyltransferase